MFILSIIFAKHRPTTLRAGLLFALFTLTLLATPKSIFWEALSGKQAWAQEHSSPSDPSSGKLDLAARIQARISAHQRALGDEVRIGISVIDGNSGKCVYERNASEGLAAASNAKLITTAAALALLGPQFQFRTQLLASGIEVDGSIAGDLYIRGRGNPLFDAADMARLVRHLRAKGVTRVRGRVVVDNSYFDQQNLPPHFNEQPTEQSAFRSPIAATSYSFNAFALFVRPALSGEGPTRIEVRPPSNYVTITNTSTTIAKGRSRLRMKTSEQAKQIHIALSGQLRKEVIQRRFRKRVSNPVLFVGSGLQVALADAGIHVSKKRVRSGKAPDDALVLATHESPPLATVIRGMGKFSNNFVAELLLKVIGAETRAKGEPATWGNGLDAVREFLGSAGFPKGSYRYENGSGLFDSNRFSPRQLTSLLQIAYKNPRWGSEFFSSLSIAATDGTLHKRMENTAAAKIVRAKTGTLASASALSGKAAIDARAPLLFSILVNGFPERSIGSVRALQDEIVLDLIRTLQER